MNIKMKKRILLITAVFVSMISLGQKRILILGKQLHVGNGEVISTPAIGVENGKILFVRNALGYTIKTEDWDTIVRVENQQIYPSFVAPNSTLGLTEIDAVRATRDFKDVGKWNPHVRSQTVFNVESKVVATVRSNGVFLAQSTPRGGAISGTSSVMALDGWNWEDATIQKDDGIHVNWPSNVVGGGWWAEPQPKKLNEKYAQGKTEISDFFKMAKAYLETKKTQKDIRLEAMKGIFKGNKRVYFHVNEPQGMLDVLDFVNELKIQFPVIVGGYYAHLITDQLRDEKIPVMVVRPHSLPDNEQDDLEHPFKLPALLKEGGVKFCIQNEGDMEAMNARNIPFLAGTAQAYGLSPEDAVSAISLWSCEIMGIGDTYGSVEKGKSATLFFSTGDALEMMTNNVTGGLIDGKFVNLNDHQKELFEKYKKKYE